MATNKLKKAHKTKTKKFKTVAGWAKQNMKRKKKEGREERGRRRRVRMEMVKDQIAE